MIWTKIIWEKDKEQDFFRSKTEFPKDVLLICKFKSSTGEIYFREMVYADTYEGFDVLQEVISKYWGIREQRWILEYEWDDDYFPVAYALYPDLLIRDD